jgi:DNA-binding beta-propeller fold protein YncE
VSHPRIGIFARLAEGNTAPVRTIAGQAAKLERSTHGLALDPVNDEIFVPGGLDALLVFKGSADIGEGPIRMIHGPRTLLSSFDSVAVDPKHDEVYVALKGQGGVLVFSRTASGDVAPLRVIRGPNTQLGKTYRVAVDPENNLLFVASREPMGIVVFDRTADGDAKPKTVIAGPKSGLVRPYDIHGLSVYPAARRIYVSAADETPGPGYVRGFVGVWRYEDNGDVAPVAVIKGPNSLLTRPRAIALNPKHKEMYVVNMRENQLLTFVLPDWF